MTALPLRPAALLVITNPPQSPGCGLQSETRTEGHETAAASDASAVGRMGGAPGGPGLSLRLVKMALRLVADPPVSAPDTVTLPPLMVIGPPSDLTTSPAPTVSFPPWSVTPPSSRYPRPCVDVALLLGVIHVRSPVTWPLNTRASRPFPLPTLPRMLPVKSADTAGR